MHGRRLIAAGLLVFALAASAAAQVSVNAYVDKTELGDEETLAYTLEIAGDLDALQPIQPPDAQGLTLTQGAPVLRSQSIVNGEARLTLRWLYQPQKRGTATIRGARVRLGGREYRTDPITVTVVPQAQRGAPSAPRASRLAPSQRPTPAPSADGELFVRAEPSARRVVPGQQVVVDYVLYYEPHLRPRRTQVAGTWDAEGFWKEELEVPPGDTYPRQVTLGGTAYEAVTIRRLALFPTRTGALEIGAMDFEIELVRSPRTRNPLDPFFSPFTSRFAEEDVTAPALTLAAAPLPDGAPDAFDGAVGQFGMAAFTDRDAVAAGEPVRLTVEIRGTGNVATLGPPTVEAPPGFDRFDPEQERDLDRRRAPLSGTKTFTYTFVPQGGGDFAIPPVVWSYYDPDAGTYRTLRSSSFPVSVSGPALALTPEAPSSADPTELRGLMTEAVWQRAGRTGTVPIGVLVGGLVLPLLALLGLVAVRRRRDRRDDDSPEALALRAHPEARRRLKAARAALGDAPAFYAAVERALRGYLSERLGIPAGGLTRPALLTALAHHGIAPDTRTEVAAVLGVCEQAQFAPVVADDRAAQQKTAERAARLFAAVDAEAGAVRRSSSP